ncbi:carboxylesterase/lipase family protein [Streptomyces noursei]|uniref:carboxylesterase/lipase family protein n=1 Tax=Streptomyces noursei TaxID=1971 RepID=UPI00045EF4AA|nr:carboxylesterase family protein [Streptomyces noursei]AIA08460.1 carboxylesterase [Streptomyces noursei]
MRFPSRRLVPPVLALGLTSAVCLGAPAPPAAASGASGRPLVTTEAGRVRGVDHGAYRTFAGIPYAAPPVGELRWRLPAPARPWSGVRDADRPGSPCPQAASREVRGGSTDEDCLYLNVTVPRTDRHLPLPVVVWLHGGGFLSGAGSSYDAHRMVERGNVVVVTLNYRLGIFGGFGYPGLAGSGDFGLADQQAALRWVRRNAVAFGGDRHNVTLAGESAGGMSTCTQLTSPSAAGLFAKAVVQSGACTVGFGKNAVYPGVGDFSPWTSLPAVQSAGRQAAGTLGCAQASRALSCLRAKPAAELLRANQDFQQVSYGTPLVPRRPATALRDGRFHRVPVLQGDNRDEMRAYVAALQQNQPITAESYRALLQDTFGDRAGRFAAVYSPTAYGTPALAWAALNTDRVFACPTLAADRLLARHTTAYAYEFADRDAPGVGYPRSPELPLGAAHATELPYLFDLGGRHASFTRAQDALATDMLDSWTAFARNGAPAGRRLAPWPQVTAGAAAPYVQQLDTGAGAIHRVDLAAEHHCRLWPQG